jgi:hypothetical protein
LFTFLHLQIRPDHQGQFEPMEKCIRHSLLLLDAVLLLLLFGVLGHALAKLQHFRLALAPVLLENDAVLRKTTFYFRIECIRTNGSE